LPQVDRRALEQQARAEAVQARPKPLKVASVTASAGTPPVSRRLAQREQTASVRPAAARPAAARPAVRQAAARPAPVRQASSTALDLSEITGICRAASSQADAASFLSSLARVRSLSEAQGASLRTSCAAYQAGRADAARANNQGTPGL
jgi:hypothetical protein